MYEVDYAATVDKIFRKLSKKNKAQLEIIHSKIEEIAQNPHHYKNLRHPMQHLRRVHIDGCFVLLFAIDEKRRVVSIEDYGHHDRMYLHKK